jgi:hypothetical protein
MVGADRGRERIFGTDINTHAQVIIFKLFKELNLID